MDKVLPLHQSAIVLAIYANPCESSIINEQFDTLLITMFKMFSIVCH